MGKMLTILRNSLRLTIQELMVNKLRTALSLIGISFGIFCIIGVLATVNSLERNIQDEIKGLGSNTIYIDKWEYSGGSDYPFWKFVNRPAPKYEEMAFIKQRTHLVKNIAFNVNNNGTVEYKDNVLQGVIFYGITEEQNAIQPVTILYGRYISPAEFAAGSNVVILGFDNAEKLFTSADLAIRKEVILHGKKARVIGVLKKSGQNLVGWNYDHCVMVPYRFIRNIFDMNRSGAFIMVQGKETVEPSAFKDELKGVMRLVRKLSPKTEDNFTLNDVSGFSDRAGSFFVTMNIGGWAIGILSLIVGGFGIANIMFVTVKERTPMIGLKKAVGAKRKSILLEFLMEAAIICIIGGLIGLFLVYILTIIFTQLLNFPVFISPGIFTLAISICIITGILAGLVPAIIAARLDPVVAIRSK